ncbi:MAG: methionyl-tRNA formyltransferase [Candidatus Latescibacterota bacterium]
MTKGKLNVVFMGSPEFAVPSLHALAQAPDIDILSVVTQPDREKGRGRAVCPTPVRAAAQQMGLPSMVMTKDGYAESVTQISRLFADAIVVVAFGLILKQDLLDMPPAGCINLHASLLPEYRGVSPIQAAILAGDDETGCTTIHMDRGIDTGDILLCERVAITPEDTAHSLAVRLSQVGGHLIVRTLRGLRQGTIQAVRQDTTAGSYTKKIHKEHGQIDWTQPCDWIARFIRAMSPWPSAYTFLHKKRLIVLDAAAVAGDAGKPPPGSILSVSPFIVACGSGAIEIRQVKSEGKTSVTAEAFTAGTRLREGDALG